MNKLARILKGKLPIAVILALILPLIPLGGVFAATSADVTVNATPSYLSISLNVSTFDYGSVIADTDENTTAGWFGVTNESSVASSTTVVSNGWQDTNDGSTPWTWDAAGENQGRLLASDGDGAYDVTVDDSTPVALASGTAALTDWVFELELDAPSSFTHGHAQGTTVTLTCSAD